MDVVTFFWLMLKLFLKDHQGLYQANSPLCLIDMLVSIRVATITFHDTTSKLKPNSNFQVSEQKAPTIYPSQQANVLLPATTAIKSSLRRDHVMLTKAYNAITLASWRKCHTARTTVPNSRDREGNSEASPTSVPQKLVRRLFHIWR